MKKLILIAVILNVFSFNIFSQEPKEPPTGIPEHVGQMFHPTKSFLEIQTEANNYFDSINLINPGTVTANEKLYRRWEYFWQDRISYPGAPDGGDFTMGAVSPAASTICNSSPVGIAAWQFTGPASRTTQSMGIIISLEVHPTNAAIMYAGSNTAGLWKTSNGGLTGQI